MTSLRTLRVDTDGAQLEVRHRGEGEPVVCTVRGVSHAENVELPDATHCMMQSNPMGPAELLATSSRAIPCARDRRQRRRHPGLQGDPLPGIG
jgi:hypothetical protein